MHEVNKLFCPRPLIPVLLAFIFGIITGKSLSFYSEVLIFFLLILIVITLSACLLVRPSIKFTTFLILFFLIGMLLIINTGHHPSALKELADRREKVILEGTILCPVKFDRDTARVEIRAERLHTELQAKRVDEKVYVTIYNHTPGLSPGQRIRFPARLRLFTNFNNPGKYNYTQAMALRGFTCSASISDGRRIVMMGEGGLGFFPGRLEAIRGPIRKLFQRALSSKECAIFRALILGEKQEIDHELREPFHRAGLGHLLAVSGLHIGLVAWISFSVFKWLLTLSYGITLKTNIRNTAALITCLPVIAYTCLAGFQVSSQRAMIMTLVYLVSMIIGREKEIWSTLSLACLAVLALNPNELFSLSFQLSFLAVVGILLLVPVLFQLIPGLAESRQKKSLVSSLYLYFWGLIFATISATIFLLPLTVAYFNSISLVSIPANLTTVPIVGLWILPLGLIGSFFAHVSTPLAEFFLQASAWGVKLMMNIIQFWGHFSWATLWVFKPSLFEIILSYILFLSVFFRKQWRPARYVFLLILFLFTLDCSFWLYSTRFSNKLRVTFFDVGDGNSALVQFPGKERMLIDGGGFSNSSFDMGRMVVGPALFSKKIMRVDYVVLSHPQSDHMGGLRFISSNFHPREFWYNGDSVQTPSFIDLMSIIKSKEIDIILPKDLENGREISGVKVTLLHPSKKTESTTLNNNSMVLRLSHKGWSFLFPGDLENKGERALTSKAKGLLKSDILLVPHHGSKESSSEGFLREIGPDIAIISAGKDNYFGRPHAETIERLEKAGCRIIRIDQTGAVEITASIEGLDIRAFYPDLQLALEGQGSFLWKP